MTSTTRALFLLPVVTSVLTVAAASIISEADEAQVRRPQGSERTPATRHAPIAVAAEVSTSTRTPSAPAPVAIVSSDVAITSPSAAPRVTVLDGLVVDADGAPIEAATVEATDGDGVVVASTTSRADGAFVLDPATAPIYVTARAPGHVQSGQVLGDLPPGSSGRLAPLVLHRTASIRGVVASPQGPVPGANVRIENHGGCCRNVKRLSTDENGRFELASCQAGRYSVSAELPGPRRRYSPTRVLALEAGATIDVSLTLLEVHADFAVNVLAPGYPVEGTWSPRTLVFVGDDLLIDHGDPRVTRVPLEVPFDVVVHQGALIGRGRVEAGRRGSDVLLEPSLRLRGRVRWPSGVPAVGARVRYEADGRPSPIESTTTDENGAFSLDLPRGLGGTLSVREREVGLSATRHVAPGESSAEITLPPTGHLRVTVAGWTERTSIYVKGDRHVALRDGQYLRLAAERVRIVARNRDQVATALVDVVEDTVTNVRLALAPAGRVRGRVVDSHGRAVRVSLALGDERTGSDAGGGFWFQRVPPGQHTLSATSPLDLVAARFHAKRATLRERVVDVAQAEELDLGDLVVEVE
jgi:hypothetical protein